MRAPLYSSTAQTPKAAKPNGVEQRIDAQNFVAELCKSASGKLHKYATYCNDIRRVCAKFQEEAQFIIFIIVSVVVFVVVADACSNWEVNIHNLSRCKPRHTHA